MELSQTQSWAHQEWVGPMWPIPGEFISSKMIKNWWRKSENSEDIKYWVIPNPLPSPLGMGQANVSNPRSIYLIKSHRKSENSADIKYWLIPNPLPSPSGMGRANVSNPRSIYFIKSDQKLWKQWRHKTLSHPESTPESIGNGSGQCVWS